VDSAWLDDPVDGHNLVVFKELKEYSSAHTMILRTFPAPK